MANGMNAPMNPQAQQAPQEQESVMQQEEAEGQQRYQQAMRRPMGPFGVGNDRLDMAAAALDAAMRRIGNDPTIGEVLEVAQIQALIAVAGELRSIRESGINQGDVM